MIVTVPWSWKTNLPEPYLWSRQLKVCIQHQPPTGKHDASVCVGGSVVMKIRGLGPGSLTTFSLRLLYVMGSSCMREIITSHVYACLHAGLSSRNAAIPGP